MKGASSYILFVFVATAIACFGQSPGQFSATSQNARWCDPSGTWYGGSDMTLPYHLTIEPIGMGRYAVRFQQAVDYPALKVLGWTDWTGEMTIGRGQKYVLHAVAFFVPSPELNMGGTPEMDAIRSIIEFSDNCSTIQHTIDAFIGYVPWTEEKVPFVTNPEWNFLELFGITTLQERYHRMPTVCRNCPFFGSPNSMLRGEATQLRFKKR